MDVITYIRQQMNNAYQQLDTIMQDITEDQFNWLPSGTINPISVILVHVLGGEDFFVQSILQAKPRIWESQKWGQNIGIQEPPGPGSNWDEIRAIKMTMAPLLAYGQALRKATDTYLANLTPAELEHQVNFAGQPRSVAEILMILVVHIASHAGEMAAVKGMQGIKGLPF